VPEREGSVMHRTSRREGEGNNILHTCSSVDRRDHKIERFSREPETLLPSSSDTSQPWAGTHVWAWSVVLKSANIFFQKKLLIFLYRIRKKELNSKVSNPGGEANMQGSQHAKYVLGGVAQPM
jgi:hypothetical protein